jgi:hypothetical protein
MNQVISYEDVERGDYAIPCDGCVYWLTPAKKYEILNKENGHFMFRDEEGQEQWCRPVNSSYLKGKNWKFEKAIINYNT